MPAGAGLSRSRGGGSGRPAAPAPQAAMPATVVPMSPRPDGKLDTHERARVANAALTTEQRSAAGKARAAQLHHPTTLAQRIAKAWPKLNEEDRCAVRNELRAAGIIE